MNEKNLNSVNNSKNDIKEEENDNDKNTEDIKIDVNTPRPPILDSNIEDQDDIEIIYKKLKQRRCCPDCLIF